MNTEAPSYSDLVAAIRRRFPRMFLIAFLVLLATFLIAYGPKPVYTSSAIIVFESPDVPADIVRSTITANREEYIQNITKRVNKSAGLATIVQEDKLYDGENLDMEQRIGKLRQSIDVEPVLEESMGLRRGALSDMMAGFSVAFSHSDRRVTQKVARALVRLFIDENIASRTEAASEASRFLASDAAKNRAEIDRTEQALTAFKAQNGQLLPEFTAVTQAQLERSEIQVTQLQQSLQAVVEREILLRAQLAQVSRRLNSTQATVVSDPRERLEDLQAEYVRLSSMYTPEHPDIIRLRRAIEQAKTQAGVATTIVDISDTLAAREAELREAQRKYAPDHPDVVRLSKAVDQMRAQLSAASAQQMETSTPNNPAYIQLQAQLDAAAAEKRSIQNQIEQLRLSVEESEQRLLKMPEVERQLAALTRDHDLAAQKFEASAGRQGRAELAENLEAAAKGERLAVKVNAPLPESPSFPNRVLIIFLGVVFSITLAAAYGVVMEMTDQSIRSSRDIATVLGAMPIAVIPRLENDADRRRRRIRTTLATAACAASVALVAILMVVNS